MNTINILCTADLHIGRSSSVSHEIDLDLTSQGAWRRITDLAISDGADAVVIAGDVFDSLASSLQERKKFHDGVMRLGKSGIPVIAVTGNHDFDALPSYAAAFPCESFILLGSREWNSRVVPTNSGQVRFLGQSFNTVYERSAATSPILDPIPGVPTIGILHGELVANSVYRPIPISVLDHPAEAWVLGHIHIPQGILGTRVPAIYPGSPQALDFGETGIHGVNWLKIEGMQASFGATIPISTIRYAIETVDVSGESSSPNLSLEKAVRERAKILSLTTSEGSYCSLRVNALVSERWNRKVEGPIQGEGFEWQLVTITVPPSIDDVFRDVNDSSAVGYVARIVAGLLADDGDPRAFERNVAPEWIQLAQEVAARATTELQMQYRTYAGKAASDHRVEHLPPDLLPEDAIKRAKQYLLASSLDLYRQLNEQLDGGAS
jgi:predicted phosphodiesterase